MPMTALLARPVADVINAAQQLLARRMGASVKLVDPVDLGGSGRTLVLRVRVAENTFSLPRTLIIKAVRQSARGGLGAEPGVSSVDSAFLREAVSYQFATALARSDRPGPDLLAQDLQGRLLILSDLGVGAKLSKILCDGSPAMIGNSLMAYAQALGRLHAATAGREGDFTALLRRAEVAHHSDGVAAQAITAADELPKLLEEQLELTVPDAVVDQIRRGRRLFIGGRFPAFSPADLCPDNVIVNDDVRFIDYEWGGFRDATLDVAYALASFPGCLCRYDLTADRADAMVDAWRAEVVGIWPQLRDDAVLARRVLEAQLQWVWLSTYWFLPEDHARIAAARDHGLTAARSHALPARWAGLRDAAGRTGWDELAEFAAAMTSALEAQWRPKKSAAAVRAGIGARRRL